MWMRSSSSLYTVAKYLERLEKFEKNVELEQKNVGLSFCFFNVKTMTTYPSSKTAEKWNAIF